MYKDNFNLPENLNQVLEKKAFPHVRAGGSLNHGVYTRDGEASAIAEASLSDTSLGKQKKRATSFVVSFSRRESCK